MAYLREKLIDKTKKSIILPLKKAVVTAATVAVLSFGAVNGVSAADNSKLTTVYYVYLNDSYIGTVSDKAVVESVVDEKMEAMKGSYQNLHLAIGGELTYIPEQVFRSTANNQEVVNKLDKEMNLQAEAAAISIDGKSIVYLENKAMAEEVMKMLQLQYVTEDQLKALEARKVTPDVVLPSLTENETRLLDVLYSKNVSILEEKVEPTKILTVDDAVTFLQKGTLEEKKYNVQNGDVLGSIAEGHQLTMEQILMLNADLTEDSVLKVGQEINVTVPVAHVEVIVEKEVFKKETIAYQNEIVEDTSMPKGETSVKQEGKDGIRTVIYAISEQNGNVLKQEATKEEIVQQPVNHIVVKGTKVIPSRGDGSFAWPASGGYISSKQGYRWGKLHKGIDIARPSNRTIKATDNGVVVSAGFDGGYGNKITIDHQNGFRTIYGHLASIDVSVGQTVSKGSKIGIMGSTGDSTGVHLHFEIYKGGNLQNPLDYIK
jgi:murein DD-endopeptidase MepM/ murein hydrolase activator NlpD